MIQIRSSVFETNSSSTHSICIAKGKLESKDLPHSAYFDAEYYGWEHECVADTCSYLYTAILDVYDREIGDKCLQRLKDILQKHNIEANFMEQDSPRLHNHGIDHVDELVEFIDTITQDEDMLLRFLFHPESCVYTGNDNSHEETDICRCAEPTIFSLEKMKLIDNPLHDPEHFDYWYKSN